jgi:hypothetical protein
MVYQQYRLAIPANPEYSVPQLRMMLRMELSWINGSLNSDRISTVIE